MNYCTKGEWFADRVDMLTDSNPELMFPSSIHTIPRTKYQEDSKQSRTEKKDIEADKCEYNNGYLSATVVLRLSIKQTLHHQAYRATYFMTFAVPLSESQWKSKGCPPVGHRVGWITLLIGER